MLHEMTYDELYSRLGISKGDGLTLTIGPRYGLEAYAVNLTPPIAKAPNYVPPGWKWVGNRTCKKGDYVLCCQKPTPYRGGVEYILFDIVVPSNNYDKPLTDLVAPKGYKFKLDAKGNIEYRPAELGEVALGYLDGSTISFLTTSWNCFAILDKLVYDNVYKADLDSLVAPKGYEFLIEGGKRAYRNSKAGEYILGAVEPLTGDAVFDAIGTVAHNRLILLKVPEKVIASSNAYGTPLDEVKIPAGYKPLLDTQGKRVYRVPGYRESFVQCNACCVQRLTTDSFYGLLDNDGHKRLIVVKDEPTPVTPKTLELAVKNCTMVFQNGILTSIKDIKVENRKDWTQYDAV
jgi:hypothetical protein